MRPFSMKQDGMVLKGGRRKGVGVSGAASLPASFLLIWLAWAPAASAQLVETRVSADSLRIGDTFDVGLIISRSGGYPDIALADSIFKGDVVELERRRFKTGPLSDSVIIRMQFFSVKDTVLPGIPVKFFGAGGDTTIRSSRIPLFFKPMIADSALDQTELRPIKPIFDFPRPWWHYALAVSLLLVLALAARQLMRRWRARGERSASQPSGPPPVFVDPLQTLQDAVDGLASQTDHLKDGDYPGFYVELGNAIRAYMETVYAITALEMTSYEIIRSLQAYHAHESLIRATRTVLREADKVKFAKFNPTKEMARHAVDTAREFCATARSEDRYRIDRMRDAFETAQAAS